MPSATLGPDPVDILDEAGFDPNDSVTIQNRSASREVKIWWAEPADVNDPYDYLLRPFGEIDVSGEATIFAWSHTTGVTLSVNAASVA